MVRVLFHRPLPERCVTISRHTALQWSVSCERGGPAGVDVFVAAAADDEGLASAHRHEVFPARGLRSAGPVEVGEFPDVVDLKVRPGLTELAALGQEPVDQLVAPRAGQDRRSVGEDRGALPVGAGSRRSGRSVVSFPRHGRS